jgi:hypothetical protein
MPESYRTGVLWGVLLLLLTLGTAGSAFVVWAATRLLGPSGSFLDLAALVAALFVTVVLFLLLTGILYRVDRLRGVPHRRVELFE